MTVLKVDNLHKDFTLHTRGRKTIRGFGAISFEIDAGQVLVLAGPSGVGKSSALKCIFRTYLPSGGEIRYHAADGRTLDLATLPEHRILQLRRQEIGYVTQFLKVLPRVPALDVVSEPLVQLGHAWPSARQEAARLLTRLNIPQGLQDAFPATFSGGEQQRVNIARAVISRPRLLLLDEPTASLDADSVERVLGLLNDLRQKGTTMVMICHDQAVAARMADKVLPMVRPAPAVSGEADVPAVETAEKGRFLIAGGDLVLPDRIARGTDVLVADGKIADVGDLKSRNQGLPTVRADGCWVLPGFMDLHSDAIEKAIQPRPRAELPLAMALTELDKTLAACGITTMHHCISFTGKEDSELRFFRRSAELVRQIKALAPSLLVRTRVHARYEILETQAAPLIESLLADDQIDLLSLMDHTPGQGQFRNEAYLYEYYTKASHLSRDQVQQLVERRLALRRQFDDGHVRALVEACRSRQIPTASHDDDTAVKVDWVRDMGVQISEFPVTLDAARRARDLGMDVLMGAPNIVFGRSLSDNLSGRQAIGKGCCNVIGSDYSPNTLLHAVFTLAGEGLGHLPQLVRMVSFNPARAVGREKETGSIAAGLAADLVIVDPGGAVPRVKQTFVAGRSVYACQ